ncbi:flagellar assembly protein FliW [Thiorhodococcus mannitoliphagus]|uniref:Flagellar assembly factor FliW n=1 Tax=Thiorhodococcus mannitoliphagus TaxID=329406 RepID=A0A6P1DUH1_9GAMM|nr:flagellar assembly protein FliW [Thiorhodococcus mannitoliphagus]NEX21977.1 flagellar assembly protein FliW [Thiorhodococcus mannitoliphagus]
MTEKTNLLSDSDPLKEVIFPRGIPGFEDLTRYRVLYSDTESGRVYWMESCEDSEIRFTLVDPTFYSLHYVLELTDDEETLLQAETPEEIVVLLMLWKDEQPDQDSKPGLHANIAAPILINVEKRIGTQKSIPSPRVEMSISN